MQPVAVSIFPSSDAAPVAQQLDLLRIDAFAMLCVFGSASNENVGIDAFVEQLMKYLWRVVLGSVVGIGAPKRSVSFRATYFQKLGKVVVVLRAIVSARLKSKPSVTYTPPQPPALGFEATSGASGYQKKHLAASSAVRASR
jgi:hypothetical protein